MMKGEIAMRTLTVTARVTRNLYPLLLAGPFLMLPFTFGCNQFIKNPFSEPGKPYSPNYMRCDKLEYSMALTSDGSSVCQMLVDASAHIPEPVPLLGYTLDFFIIEGLDPSAVPEGRVRVIGWNSTSGK